VASVAGGRKKALMRNNTEFGDIIFPLVQLLTRPGNAHVLKGFQYQSNRRILFMRFMPLVVLVPLALGGCLSFSSSNPPPPASNTTVVVPQR
jgi:hypothetical protein